MNEITRVFGITDDEIRESECQTREDFAEQVRLLVESNTRFLVEFKVETTKTQVAGMETTGVVEMTIRLPHDAEESFAKSIVDSAIKEVYDRV